MSKLTISKDVLIIDDHPLIRAGIKQFLEAIDNYKVIEASDSKDALKLALNIQPAFILLDLCFYHCDAGFSLLTKFNKFCPNSKVIIISMYDDIKRVAKAFKLGANGYFLKTEPPSNLLKAIDKIENNSLYLCEELRSLLIEYKYNSVSNPTQFEIVNQLSAREKEVLALIALGITTQEIADKLFISKKTVESHRINIKRKLNLRNLNELIKFAVEWSSYNASQN